ncbi:hypothetical protein [Staphylococcus kloosii]|uniref:Uncharacterized protein n=1 Tax=Staphylococcus kloosii TaxID=29384 RepID=A0ABQ0XJX6_9STAP|nr:hypothetical protein [Staphylococcus kloosii]AVQ36605.1 hypothetical protein C7J89_10730 [Staphylococcus kloosii]PNZ03967.1 hypothetical protein CD136_09880 [Staphylococcus kloosii]GEP81429.1 hypothetical protein SKL01_06070 [Staphylococcus kloosii]SUM49697.1 Uncharacterised protein [Staphylococcus kloosii]
MKIIDLNLDDYIWFIEPGSNISYPATVTKLVYNDDKPYAEVLVGQHKVRIDDGCQIALGERVSK